MASLRYGTNLGGQTKTGPSDGAEIKCPGAHNPARAEMRSSGADDPAAEDPAIDDADADTPDADI